MVSLESHSVSSEQVTARVRQNVIPAGIAALLMLYFSYSGGGFVDPEGGDAFAIGGMIFICTLKYGGFAMLAAALWSLSGMRVALLFDAVCSVLIGLLLCTSGGLMMAGGGSGFLYVVFGVLFLWGGVRNGRNWAEMASVRSVGSDKPMSHELDVAVARAIDDGPMLTQAGDLESHDTEPAGSTEDRSSPDGAEPPPEGFLASFAPEDRHDDE